MKKLLMALALLPLMAAAETDSNRVHGIGPRKETVDGVEWTYCGSGVGFWLDEKVGAVSKSTAGSIVIPSTLGDSPVRGIENGAFSGCCRLTSVTIPTSVRWIGRCKRRFDWFLEKVTSASANERNEVVNGAFSDCIGLTSVTIPSSVREIGDRAFSDCTGLTSVMIPSSVNSIGVFAFSGCSGLTSVTIPLGVTEITDSSFAHCTGLTSVTISHGVSKIGDRAFYGCTGLTSVTIPSNVRRIGNSAFSGCSGLTSVTIPPSVTSIGDSAFFGCSGLTSVTIPQGVTNIGPLAFAACGILHPCTNETGTVVLRRPDWTVDGRSGDTQRIHCLSRQHADDDLALAMVLLSRYEVEVESRHKEYVDFEKMSGEATKLSEGAKRLYDADIARAKESLKCAQKKLRELKAVLAPEKVAERKKQGHEADCKGWESNDWAEYESMRKKFLKK